MTYLINSTRSLKGFTSISNITIIMILTDIRSLAESIGVSLNEPFTFFCNGRLRKGMLTKSGFRMMTENNVWREDRQVLSRLVEGSLIIMKEPNA